MTDSLRVKRERREEIDEILRGTLTCPVCQSELIHDTQNRFMCMSMNEPCIYIDFIISSPLLDEPTGKSPLSGEQPTDTSWRKMKRKPLTSYGTEGGVSLRVGAFLSLLLIMAIIITIAIPIAKMFMW